VKKGLIGYTGFVGNNLSQQTQFSDYFNSKNSQLMEGKVFDLVVCCGVSATKWLANKDPEADLKNIGSLQNSLKKVKVKKFILISTVDVYTNLFHVDELTDSSYAKNHSYGEHRREFEVFCQNNFPNVHIIRLPGLFGVGLKKNIIYDLINDNCLDAINPDSIFQYYDLNCLWDDICKVISEGIELINLCSEPVATVEIINQFFPSAKVENSTSKQQYDVKSRFVKGVWGREGYRFSHAEIMSRLGGFIEVTRGT
jgi:hypothetical protein